MLTCSSLVRVCGGGGTAQHIPHSSFLHLPLYPPVPLNIHDFPKFRFFPKFVMPMSCDVLLTMSKRLDVVGYFVGLLTESRSRSRLVGQTLRLWNQVESEY